MWSVLSWQCRHCPPLFYVGGCFVCIHVCAPCTLLVSLKGRPGRVPNPLKLKLQITKPPCGCWELLFWHQLLPSKKIPTYQTAEQGGNIPGPWSFSVRSEKCRRLSACADSRPQCLLLSVVNCYVSLRCLVMSEKDGCDLCIRLAAFARGTDGELWLFRRVFGRHWQLMQWVSPSLQGRHCCYGDKWEPGKLILCSNNSLMSAERFGDINVNCRYSGFTIVYVPVPLRLCHPPLKSGLITLIDCTLYASKV